MDVQPDVNTRSLFDSSTHEQVYSPGRTGYYPVPVAAVSDLYIALFESAGSICNIFWLTGETE